MGTPWWTGETGTSGVNPDFHNTSDNLVIRLIPAPDTIPVFDASGIQSGTIVNPESGILKEKNLLRYGRELEEIALWINDIYPRLKLSIPIWYLYDSEENNRESNDGWEPETDDTFIPGTGFLTLRKQYIPTSGLNNLINLDDKIQNQFQDIQNALNREIPLLDFPASGGFYQRFNGVRSDSFTLPASRSENLPIPFGPTDTILSRNNQLNLTIPQGRSNIFNNEGANVEALEGVNYMRPKATMAFVENDPELGDVITIYNLLGPMFSLEAASVQSLNTGTAGLVEEHNLLCKLKLRSGEDDDYFPLDDITAIDIDQGDNGVFNIRRIWAAFNDGTIRAFDIHGKEISKYSAGNGSTSISFMSDVEYNIDNDPQWFGVNNDEIAEFEISVGHSIYYLDAGKLKALRLEIDYTFIRIDTIELEDTGAFVLEINPGSTNGIKPNLESDSTSNISSPFNFVRTGSVNIDQFEQRKTLLISKGSIIYEVPLRPKGRFDGLTLSFGNAFILIVDKSIVFGENIDRICSVQKRFTSLRRHSHPDFEHSTKRNTMLIIDGETLKIRTLQQSLIGSFIVGMERFERKIDGQQTFLTLVGGFINENGGGGPSIFRGANYTNTWSLDINEPDDPDEIITTFFEQRQILSLNMKNLLANELEIENDDLPGVGAGNIDGVELYLKITALPRFQGQINVNPVTVNIGVYTGPYPTGEVWFENTTDAHFFAEGNILTTFNVALDLSVGFSAFVTHQFFIKIPFTSEDIRADGFLHLLIWIDKLPATESDPRHFSSEFIITLVDGFIKAPFGSSQDKVPIGIGAGREAEMDSSILIGGVAN